MLCCKMLHKLGQHTMPSQLVCQQLALAGHNRSLVVTSHLGPAATHAVWALCWALGLHTRSPSHPPLVMLQDLYVPRHKTRCNSAVSGDAGVADDRQRASLVLVGVGESLLCLCLWPDAATRTSTVAGGSAALPVPKGCCCCMHCAHACRATPSSAYHNRTALQFWTTIRCTALAVSHPISKICIVLSCLRGVGAAIF